MLKSELAISQEIESLDNQLSSYCINVQNLTFSDENKESEEIYVVIFRRLNNLLKGDQEQFRKKIEKHLIKVKNILTVINIILTKDNIKIININAELFDNTKQQIAIVYKNINDLSKSQNINSSIVFQYYLNSLQLLTYFTAIRSSIATIKNINKIFNQNENSCVLKFINTNNTSFSISQQREIIEFVEKILNTIFYEHMDIITVDFDTGSPELEIVIKIVTELDLNILISELFELIFKRDMLKIAYLLITILAMLIGTTKGNDKQISDEDSDKLIDKIKDLYFKLIKTFKIVPKRKKTNKIELQVSSPEGQSSHDMNKTCLLDEVKDDSKIKKDMVDDVAEENPNQNKNNDLGSAVEEEN